MLSTSCTFLKAYLLSFPQCLIRLGSHEPVKPGVPRETVFKGNDIPGTANQSAACRHIGDVGKLVLGNVQELGQFLPVSGGLIEQNQKLTVCQHEPGGVGPEQLVG